MRQERQAWQAVTDEMAYLVYITIDLVEQRAVVPYSIPKAAAYMSMWAHASRDTTIQSLDGNIAG